MISPTLIFHGKKIDKEPIAIAELVTKLRAKREYMHSLSVDALLDFFQAVVAYWQTSGLLKRNLYEKNLVEFCTRKKLTQKLAIALHGNYKALDSFVDLGDPDAYFHAQPRGLSVQWLAGNVSVLGLFSIFSSILTKNVCLAKASTRGYEELGTLLDTLNRVRTRAISGRELSQAIAVVLVDRDDTVNQEALSLAADIRIAWGGKEAIETVMQLKKQVHCEDIMLGPKYSYALIDAISLQEKFRQLAQRLAVDVCVFDQEACSSPHTVFIEGTKDEVVSFAKELAKQLQFVGRTMIPKGPVDSGKSMEIVTLRSFYALKGKVFASEGTEWTVIVSEEEGLTQRLGSRVIVLKPIQNIRKVSQYNDRQKQTLGISLSEQGRAYLDEITLFGIDRCPQLGRMTFYESVWDGMFIFDRLTRWVSVDKNA